MEKATLVFSMQLTAEYENWDQEDIKEILRKEAFNILKKTIRAEIENKVFPPPQVGGSEITITEVGFSDLRIKINNQYKKQGGNNAEKKSRYGQ